MKQQNKEQLKLLKDLIDASYEKGYMNAINDTATHGIYPTEKDLKNASKEVEEIYNQLLEVLNLV